MKLGYSEKPKEASFDLTPMIDVVMLLIVFFTMTSQFTRTEQKPVDLPREAGDPGRSEPANPIFIDIDAKGVTSVLGEPVEVASLAATGRLHSAGSDGGVQGEIVVRADKACSVARLNEVATVLRAAGLTRWKLATAPDGGVGGGGGGGGGGGLP